MYHPEHTWSKQLSRVRPDQYFGWGNLKILVLKGAVEGSDSQSPRRVGSKNLGKGKGQNPEGFAASIRLRHCVLDMVVPLPTAHILSGFHPLPSIISQKN